MGNLEKKLTELIELVKALKAVTPTIKAPTLPKMPTIKPPPTPSMTPTKAVTPKLPGAGPDSKKDPKKVAQQIKDGSMSTKTQKVMLKFDKNGQWSLEKGAPKIHPTEEVTEKIPLHAVPKPEHKATVSSKERLTEGPSRQGDQVRLAAQHPATEHAIADRDVYPEYEGAKGRVELRNNVRSNEAKARKKALAIAKERYKKLKAQPKPNLTKSDIDFIKSCEDSTDFVEYLGEEET